MMVQEPETSPQPVVHLDFNQSVLLAVKLLTDLIENEGGECQSIFNSQDIPSISLQAYLRRVHRYTRFSPQCIFIALIYLDRYNMEEQEFSLNWSNVHRLFLTCLMMAVKFNDDIYFDNLTFEKGGGVSISQLFRFELQIFSKMSYNAFVEAGEYENLVDKLYSVYRSSEES